MRLRGRLITSKWKGYIVGIIALMACLIIYFVLHIGLFCNAVVTRSRSRACNFPAVAIIYGRVVFTCVVMVIVTTGAT